MQREFISASEYKKIRNFGDNICEHSRSVCALGAKYQCRENLCLRKFDQTAQKCAKYVTEPKSEVKPANMCVNFALLGAQSKNKL